MKLSPSLRGSEATAAIHNQNADSSSKVDCHAIATALARNDRKNTTSKKWILRKPLKMQATRRRQDF